MWGRRIQDHGLGAALLGALVLTSGPGLAQDGDPEAGAKVYNRCRACHVIDKEQNRVGPHLVGVMGREAGAVEGFKYSDALAESGIVWDDATIAGYMADPKGYIPGNRMVFAGLNDEEDIANLIAYLKEASSGG